MPEQPISLSSSGPPQTVVEPADPALVAALTAAMAASVDQQRSSVVELVAANPRFLDGWVAIGRLGRDPVEAYAAFRVGYHRGLDTLRASGWRGSGYVLWEHESNRGFLRSLLGLHLVAGAIGEADEHERCGQFLLQCDPRGLPDDELESMSAIPALSQ